MSAVTQLPIPGDVVKEAIEWGVKAKADVRVTYGNSEFNKFAVRLIPYTGAEYEEAMQALQAAISAEAEKQ